MRRHVLRTLLVGCATVAAVALGAGQAFAASTITITGAGGTVSATGTVVLDEPSSGQNISCPLTMNGSLANVMNAPLPYTTTQVGGSPHSITSANACSSGNTTLTPVLPWDIVFTSVSATAPQASGFVEGANASGLLFHASFLTCRYDIAGQADFAWTNGSANQFTFTGNGTLHAVNVAGCFGTVSAGDVLTLTGTLTVTPPFTVS